MWITNWKAFANPFTYFLVDDIYNLENLFASPEGNNFVISIISQLTGKPANLVGFALQQGAQNV